MKKIAITFLWILLVYPAIMSGQNEMQVSKEKMSIDSAGNYNDYIIEHWKKSKNEFKKVAKMLNEPIKSKAALLIELKAATKVFNETKILLDNLNEYEGSDMKFRINTIKLLDHYKHCTEKVYPEIADKLTKPKPDYTELQAKLDELNKIEDKLNVLFLKSQEAFAELYKLELN